MTNPATCQLGMIGLGVMGRNLLLNMSRRGFTVAGFDTDAKQVASLESANIFGTTDLPRFIAALSVPRTVMLLVPAGEAVDQVIQGLLPHLTAGDLIIDGGNSYFKDSDRRAAELATQDIHFLAVGISGGEQGALHGPSIMPSGPLEAYIRVQPFFEAIAAHIDATPCVTYLGKRSAGHFVKMVHNGIEYGLMQLIAESYHVMKRGLDLNASQLHATYATWNKGELNSYLLDITQHIFATHDARTNAPLINVIQSIARQKGTGLWTSQSAMELHVPIPTIDIAVAMRDLSVLQTERQSASQLYGNPETSDALSLIDIEHALYVAMLLTYAQGFALLQVASDHYQYDLDLAAVARIWRGGCIIRSALLEDLVNVFHDDPTLANVLLNKNIAEKINARLPSLRVLSGFAARSGIPMPGMLASLSYFDAFRSATSPANLIQAQRDYFGAHTYERIDASGSFHTEWNNT